MTSGAGDGDTMLGYLLVRPGELELRELPRPHPESDGVVLRIRTALTCGTDLKTLARGHPKFPMPMPFGHEFAGEIAELGADVTELREGDPVMAAPTAPCGACYCCVRGQENLCPEVMPTMVHGAFAEYIRLPGRIVRTNLYRKPRDLPYRTAALLEPLACVVHGLSMVRLRPDDTVVLIGGGAITILHLHALRAQGVEDIVVVARNAQRAEEAVAAGAAEGIAADATGPEAFERVRERTAGRGADVVIECTGSAAVWQAAVRMVRVGGQVVLFGGCPSGSDVTFEASRLHYDQVQILSPFHFRPRDVRGSYELLAAGAVDASTLVAGDRRLEDLPDVLNRLRLGQGPKFAIVPDRG